MEILFDLADLALMLLQFAIFIQVIMSWLLAFNVVNRNSALVGGLVRGLDRVTEPLFRPIRRILPDFGALDLAPLVVLLGIIVLRSTLPYVEQALLPDVI